MSFKDNLYKLVEEKGTITYGELVNFSMEEGYKVDTMTRRMRELCDERGIEPLEKIGKRNQAYIYAYRLWEPEEYPKYEVRGELPKNIKILPAKIK